MHQLARMCIIALTAGVTHAGLSPGWMVQYRSVDFINGVSEVHNIGDPEINLEGWRFCTHNFAATPKYSHRLAGCFAIPGGSLFVHTNDDAPQHGSHFYIADLAPYALSEIVAFLDVYIAGHKSFQHHPLGRWMERLRSPAII